MIGLRIGKYYTYFTRQWPSYGYKLIYTRSKITIQEASNLCLRKTWFQPALAFHNSSMLKYGNRPDLVDIEIGSTETTMTVDNNWSEASLPSTFDEIFENESKLKLKKRFFILRKYFTRQDTIELMLNCIESVTDSETSIVNKLEYLIKKVSHKPESIIKTKSLSFRYEHIITRHEFLIRAGLFKATPYHKIHKQSYFIHPSMQREKYFNPSYVVCTSDRDFLKKCTDNCLSLNELAAFEEIYKAEFAKLEIQQEFQEKQTDYSSSQELNEDDDFDTNDLVGLFNLSNSDCSTKDSTEFYY